MIMQNIVDLQVHPIIASPTYLGHNMVVKSNYLYIKLGTKKCHSYVDLYKGIQNKIKFTNLEPQRLGLFCDRSPLVYINLYIQIFN